MKKIYIFLFFILLIASFLRFYQLGQNPPSLTWDEAAWGYNAYSLGKEARDEFGRFLPLDYLESFGDFKPPVYAYLAIIPVKIFGLSEFSVRFPSAFFGVLTVLMTYFLVKTLFKTNSESEILNPKQIQNTKYKILNTELYALFSALILAISPWHIMLSRAAFEANVATFFIIAGVIFFLWAVKGSRWFIILSIISLAISLYTFNTARIVSPLLILALAIGFRKELFKIKKQVIFAVILGILLIIPSVNFLLSPQASLRFREVNIFSDIGIITNTNQEIANDNNSFWSKILHNRRLAYGVSYLKHYFDNLNPNFLFIKGDGNPKFSTQTVGQMYLWDLVFLISGIFLLIKKKEGFWWIIPLWLILGIIPAGTARETPHALRIEATLPTFQIITAYGFINLISFVKKYRIAIILLLLSLLFLNFLYFFRDYIVHYPRIYSGEWQYGYKESIHYVSQQYDNYDEVRIISSLGRPYIYYLFYTNYNPSKFRETAEINRDVNGFVDVFSFDKYRFMDRLDLVNNDKKKILFISTPDKIPSKSKQLKTFYLLNGKPVLAAFTR
ncbi:MAG: glycosyltransferase family 39 protein [Candidatus Levybacteria bacterium]|nr:glycosyltransferase family 39 protein [Candidatus Levybacteria bacterium]